MRLPLVFSWSQPVLSESFTYASSTVSYSVAFSLCVLSFRLSILLLVCSFTFYSLTCSSMSIYELWRSSSNNLIASRQSSQMDHYFQCLKICISFPALFYSLVVNHWISIDFWETVERTPLNHVFGQCSILHIVVLLAGGGKKSMYQCKNMAGCLFVCFLI